MAIDGVDSRRFRELAVERFVQLNETQNRICRAFQGLSNGMQAKDDLIKLIKLFKFK